MAASIDDVVSGNDLDTILSLLDDDFFEDQEIVEAVLSCDYGSFLNLL